mgnify:FL=1
MSTPYDYYPACLYAIQQLGPGYTLTQACNAANITVALFRRYCANDPNLNDQFIDAEQRSHDALADALVHIDNSEHGSSDPKMASVLSSNIKWYLAKKDPKRFGERVTVEHDVKVDVTITQALNRARQRTQIAAADDAVDATFVDVSPALPARR